MKIKAYSPRTGNLLAEDISGIYYGNIRQGEHCALPVLLQPVKTDEDTFSEMKVFLQNNGGYGYSEFGYLISDQFMSGVVSYTSGTSSLVYISDHFLLDSSPVFSDTQGVSLNDGDYTWLDVQVGELETGSTSNINYRFVFDYS